MLDHVCHMECAKNVYVHSITDVQLRPSLMEVILSYMAIQKVIHFMITENAASLHFPSSQYCIISSVLDTKQFVDNCGPISPFKECIMPVEKPLRYGAT